MKVVDHGGPRSSSCKPVGESRALADGQRDMWGVAERRARRPAGGTDGRDGVAAAYPLKARERLAKSRGMRHPDRSTIAPRRIRAADNAFPGACVSSRRQPRPKPAFRGSGPTRRQRELAGPPSGSRRWRSPIGGTESGMTDLAVSIGSGPPTRACRHRRLNRAATRWPAPARSRAADR